MWRLNNNLIPTPVKHYFNTSQLPTGMRQGHKYLLPYKRLDISRRHINHSGVKTWNTYTPANIKNAKTIRSFAKNHKQHLLNSI